MAGRGMRSWMFAAGALALLGGCLESGSGSTAPASSGGTTRLVEREVEAPEIFRTSEAGLWDGRPSLGGVWVAGPGVRNPERVIIRNPANGKFVIGALFRRERDLPGAGLQVSSDAAAALGLSAGVAQPLDVTALRRQESAADVALVRPVTPLLDGAETIAAETLPPAGPRPGQAQAARPAQPSGRVHAAPVSAAGGRQLVQIGIFSLEANARGAVAQLAKSGVTADLRQDASQGKTFWRVTAGPAAAGGREAMLAKVKAAGFKDAYFVSR